MAVDDARRLPLPAAGLGAVLRASRSCCSSSSSCPQLNIVVGGSARWLELGPLPAIHPAEIAKLALVIYLAHWFAKRGTRVHGVLGRAPSPFLIIVAPVIALVFKEPDLGTTTVITLTAFTMFFVAGANLVHLAADGRRGALADDRRRPARLPDGPDPGRGSTRGSTRSATGSTRSRASSRSASAGCSAPGSGRARSFGPERLQRLHLRRGRPGVRAARRPASSSLLFLLLAYSGVRVALRRARTRSGRSWRPGSPAWLCLQAFINIGVVVALLPITGHHAAVHQRRRLVAHHQLRGGRDPAVDLARDRREGDMERRCDC